MMYGRDPQHILSIYSAYAHNHERLQRFPNPGQFPIEAVEVQMFNWNGYHRCVVNEHTFYYSDISAISTFEEDASCR